MSNSLLSKPEAQFTKVEFAQASRLDRIYMYMMQPDYFENVISESDRLYLENMKIFHGFYMELLSEEKVIQIALNNISELKKCRAKAQQILNDTKALFGDLIQRNQEYERWTLKQKYLKVMAAAEKSGDYETQKKCLDSIVKLEGLARPQGAAEKIPSIELPDIQFTEDATVLEIGDDDHE